MYQYDYMFGSGFNIFCTLIALVVLIDLVLAGIWLWQNIKKN